MKWSDVTVSGSDSPWVNGVASQLEEVFKSRKLSYSILATHSSLRVILSLFTWVSLSFAILRSLWPIIVPFLEEGTGFGTLYGLVFLLGCFTVVILLEEFLSWLFPRFEYGKNPTPRRVRTWICGLLLSSGILSELFLKLLGL